MQLVLVTPSCGVTPQGTAQFLQKGAGLIEQVEQQILRRVPDLSF